MSIVKGTASFGRFSDQWTSCYDSVNNFPRHCFHGYDVDVATSAEQALTYDVRGYSLILLDIMMGEISGLQMAKILRKPYEILETRPQKRKPSFKIKS